MYNQNNQFNRSRDRKAEETFGLDNLYDIENTALTHHLDQALRANYIMLLDIDLLSKTEKY